MDKIEGVINSLFTDPQSNKKDQLNVEHDSYVDTNYYNSSIKNDSCLSTIKESKKKFNLKK